METQNKKIILWLDSILHKWDGYFADERGEYLKSIIPNQYQIKRRDDDFYIEIESLPEFISLAKHIDQELIISVEESDSLKVKIYDDYNE